MRPRAGDVLVIAGKGHEQGQELAGGRKVPFDDVAVAREALRALEAAPRGGGPRRERAQAAPGGAERTARMRGWDADRVAGAAGAVSSAGPPRASEPGRAAREHRLARAAPGELFVGLRGERADGGEHAAEALRGGRLGGAGDARARARRALEAAARAARARAPRSARGPAGARAGLAAGARERRHEGGRDHRLDRQDLDQGHPRRARSPQHCASSRARENLNTEIGLPLAVLGAPRDTEVLVLEMAMRGAGQIAELTAIAEPDVGVIVNVGPGAPRAARLAGGDRRRQGGADRRAGARRDGRACPPTSRCSRRTCARICARSRSAGGDFALEDALPGEAGASAPRLGAARRRGEVARSHSRPPATRTPAARSDHAAAVLRAGAQPAQPARRRGGRAGARGHARGPARGALLGAARRAAGAARRGGPDQRLLQRQPDVHARSDRRPGRDGPRAAGGRARRHARARPGRRALPPRDRRARGRAAGSSCS